MLVLTGRQENTSGAAVAGENGAERRSAGGWR